MHTILIYNSRNYSILLNVDNVNDELESTTVEIILYYLTIENIIAPANLQQ